MESLYIQHYKEQTAVYGAHTAILLQVGRFFEMYDSVDVKTGQAATNVQTLAEICGCATEPKPTSDPAKQKIFWGFPEPSLPKFERLLVQAGYSVVVIVQNKDGTDKVVSRTIDHVSSPGTYYEDAGTLGVRQDTQCILGLYIEPYVHKDPHATARPQTRWNVALTAFQINTGQATSMETHLTLIDGKPVWDAVHPFLAMYPPAEAIVWSSDSTELQQLKHVFSNKPVHFRQIDKKADNSVEADRLRLAFLSELYTPSSALSLTEYLGIQHHPMIRRSLAGLFQFIRDHNASYLQRLTSHILWEPEDYLILGNSALEQLAMISLNSNKPTECLLYWLQRAESAMGRRALRERCMTPITDTDELNTRQERIAALRTAPEPQALKTHIRGMYDLPRVYRRFTLGRGSIQDLLCLLTTYQRVATLLGTLKDTVCAPSPTDHAVLVAHLDHTLATWSVERAQKICAQTVATGGQGPAVGSVHPWTRGTYPELDALEDQWAVLETEALAIKQRWETHLKESDVLQWTLKDDAPFTIATTSRRAATLQGYLKGTRKDALELVKRPNISVVLLQSPRLQELNTAAIALRAQWLAAVDAIWQSYWRVWDAPAQLVAWVAQVDCELALATVANEFDYVRPTYVETADEQATGFSVQDLRHPIVERVHTAAPYHPHSVSFGTFADNTQGLLVYGVNAAGKSTFGKAVGLAILMAQIGCPVPATAMRLIPYNGLYTRILGHDNLWAGMSSFVVEMTEFRSILRSAASRILVIGDELCAGTETASATAIVAAGIQTLVKKGAHFIFATHLHELVDIPDVANLSAVRAVHLAVHSDPTTGVLTYDRTLKPGPGSPMYGLEVCKGLDMDHEFLEQAFALRKRLFSADGQAHASQYNPAVIMSRCEVCGATDSLETHHIVPQAAADAKGRVKPGQHKNTKGNLVVLCGGCHDKHHSGLLEITGWKETTAGRQLVIQCR
jgi:DNA mismatch repair protein MutS